MKISENTSVSMPVKNMLMIIAGVVAGVFAYTQIMERLTSLETSRELFQADLQKCFQIFSSYNFITHKFNIRVFFFVIIFN